LQTQFKCPLCRAVIAAADVNVATDLALCRSCGRTSSFATVSAAAEISTDILSAPPRGIKVENDFRGGSVITYRKLSPALLFLIPFTAVWSGGSMWGIYGTQLKKGAFDLSQSLFGLPFLLGTVVLLSIIIFAILGKWQISMQQGEGSVFVGVGRLGWNRSFAYGRNTMVSMCATTTRVNQIPQKGIMVRTDGKDFVFGASLKEEAKQFIAASIMKAATEA